MNKEIIDIIVKVLISVISVAISGYLIPWLKTKIETQKWNELFAFVEKCVQAAEKKYTPEEWKQKKDYVLNLASQFIMRYEIIITPEEIDALIEGMVKAVKG